MQQADAVYPTLRAVVFDVDGVLVDSLPAHLAICRDKNREYGLGLSIPGGAAIRDLVRRGIRISPMENFFLAVGFPPDLAKRANREYQVEFSSRYVTAAFPEIDQMLSRLGGANIQLGIATANTTQNIRSALGSLMRYFGDVVVSHDHPCGETKPAALRHILAMLRLAPGQLCYVGDQPSDAQAARDVGVRFLGVTYGWGISRDDGSMATVDSPSDLADHFIRFGRTGLARAV